MMNWKRKIPRTLISKKAQTTMEYVILVAIVAMLALKVKNTLNNTIGTLDGKVNSAISNDDLWN